MASPVLAWSLQAPLQVLRIGRALRIAAVEGGRLFQPGLGNQPDHLLDDRRRQPLRERLVERADAAGRVEQHVVLHHRERARDALLPAVPLVVHDQRRAVVDEPGPAVPHQQVHVARRAVHVGHVRIEPDDAGCQVGFDGVHQRIEGHRARQVVQRQVEAGAGADEVLDLGIGFGAGEFGVELREHQLGHRQAEHARQLAGHQFRDQRAAALPRAAELQHVQAVVVGLDDGGERPALAEGRDVARGGDGADHCACTLARARRH